MLGLKGQEGGNSHMGFVGPGVCWGWRRNWAGSNGHFRGDIPTGANARQVGLLQVRVPWHICSPMGFQLGATWLDVGLAEP